MMQLLMAADVTGGFHPDAKALIARMSPAPNLTRKILINTLITTLANAGVWAKLDAMWVFAADASANALLSWKGATYDATNTSCTFTTDRGFTGNGSSAFLNTNYNPSTGPLWTKDAHAFGVWVRSGSSANLIEMGADDGTCYYTLSVNPGGPTGTATDGNAAAPLTGTIALPSDLAAVRTGANARALYEDGGSINTAANPSFNVPSRTFYIGAVNDSGTASQFSANQWSAAYVGGALTGTDVSNLHTALQAYMTGVGA